MKDHNIIQRNNFNEIVMTMMILMESIGFIAFIELCITNEVFNQNTNDCDNHSA